MKNNKLICKIIKNQEKILGSEFANSRMNAFYKVKSIKKRQDSLTLNQARKEALEQAKRIRNK